MEEDVAMSSRALPAFSRSFMIAPTAKWLENAMKVIDAQAHIWSQTVVPTSGLHRKVPIFSAEELLSEMDAAGVDAALIHPPLGWDPHSNELAVDAARKYPDRFAIMGQFALDNTGSYELIHGWPD